MAIPDPADFIFSTPELAFEKAIDSLCLGIINSSNVPFSCGNAQSLSVFPLDEGGLYASTSQNEATALTTSSLTLKTYSNMGTRYPDYLVNPVVGNLNTNESWAAQTDGRFAQMPSKYTLSIYTNQSMGTLLYRKEFINSVPDKMFYPIVSFRELVNNNVFTFQEGYREYYASKQKSTLEERYFVYSNKGSFDWVSGVYPNNWEEKGASFGFVLVVTGGVGTYAIAPFRMSPTANPLSEDYCSFIASNATIDQLNSSITRSLDYTQYFLAMREAIDNTWVPPMSMKDRMIKEAVDSFSSQVQVAINALETKAISVSPSIESFLEETDTIELKFVNLELDRLVITDVAADKKIFENSEFTENYTGNVSVVGNLTTISIVAIPEWSGVNARIDCSLV